MLTKYIPSMFPPSPSQIFFARSNHFILSRPLFFRLCQLVKAKWTKFHWLGVEFGVVM